MTRTSGRPKRTACSPSQQVVLSFMERGMSNKIVSRDGQGWARIPLCHDASREKWCHATRIEDWRAKKRGSWCLKSTWDFLFSFVWFDVVLYCSLLDVVSPLFFCLLLLTLSHTTFLPSVEVCHHCWWYMVFVVPCFLFCPKDEGVVLTTATFVFLFFCFFPCPPRLFFLSRCETAFSSRETKKQNDESGGHASRFPQKSKREKQWWPTPCSPQARPDW